jgi:uncharacterized protein
MVRMMLLILCLACSGRCVAPSGAPAVKHLLIIGEEKGYRHEAVSHAAATLEMNPEQKAALLSFVRDDGKGFIGVHSAAITFADWPEYREMMGGFYDEHPWVTFGAPIVVEDANFPGMQQWPKEFVLKDEIYQMKDWSRQNVRVLMRLDSGKLDLKNPQVHRKDLDLAVAWAKMYGKGRVYYSTLGHVEQNWDDPRMQQMYVGAIKWAMGLVDADVTARALAGQSSITQEYGMKSMAPSEELGAQ